MCVRRSLILSVICYITRRNNIINCLYSLKSFVQDITHIPVNEIKNFDSELRMNKIRNLKKLKILEDDESGQRMTGVEDKKQ